MQGPPPKGPTAQAQGQQGQQKGSFEALLLAMEGRLSAKLEKASEASREAAHQAKLNSESLEQIESRVDANEAYVMEALRETEARIMAKVQEQVQEAVTNQVKEMVNVQLAAAGFDQDLTASNLSVRNSAIHQDNAATYAGIAAHPAPTVNQSVVLSKEEKREAKFLLARRSLRLWPIPGGKKECLEDFLLQKLQMDETFIKEDLGSVTLTRTKEPRNKNKDEVIVTFESKQICDAVKAAAPNLANHRETAGMRLHIPDHLQKEFHVLMNLSFDLKKRHPGLKRNIKFDEEDYGLFMDLKLSEEADWKRVKPAQAINANKKRRKQKTPDLDEDELRSLLDSEEDSDTE